MSGDTHRDGSLRSAGIALVRAWREDWNRFVSDAFGVRLDPEQREILAAVQRNRRVSVASGTARGKDFVAACAALSFLYLTPRWARDSNGRAYLAENTKVALTAPTDRQVKNIMMPEISRLYNRARARNIDLPGKLNTYEIRTESDEWFLAGFKADENNHEAWSGFHAVHTMFVVTEATGIGDDTFSAIEGNLQGDSRILLVFNPNILTGYAARSQKQDRWTRFTLNSLTAANVRERRTVIPGQVDYGWVTDRLSDWCERITREAALPEMDDFEFEGVWYRPDDLFRRKVLGKFPKVGEDALIPAQWLELAHRRWEDGGGRIPEGSPSPVLGVDVAGMGRDLSCFCERRGAWVAPFRTHNAGGGADHMKVAGMIADAVARDRRTVVCIDTIGEGAGVYSRCQEVDGRGAERYVSCKYSEAASRRGKPLHDITGQRVFLNMRAYLFWRVREWLDPKNGEGAMLPPDARLDEEARETRFSFRSDGKIYIEPKDDIKRRIGRSPDRLDALAYTFWPLQPGRGVDLSRIAAAIGR